MSEQIIEIDTAHKNVALLVYVLQGLGFFTGGLTFIAALVVNLSLIHISEPTRPY